MVVAGAACGAYIDIRVLLFTVVSGLLLLLFLPIIVMIKERRLRWLGHAARRSDKIMVKQFKGTRTCARPCGTWMHYAWAEIVHGAKLL